MIQTTMKLKVSTELMEQKYGGNSHRKNPIGGLYGTYPLMLFFMMF